MSVTAVAIFMIVATIVCLVVKPISDRIDKNYVMTIIPIACCLVLGYSINDISKEILSQLSNMMSSAGWMLMFGLMFFRILTETGMFDILLGGILKPFGGKLGPVPLMILTVILGGIGFLTASVTTSYLIVFPLLIPLYKKINLDRRYALILAQVGISAMCWIPWGIGIVNTAMMGNVDPMALSAVSMKYGLTFIPGVAFLIVYFLMQHKKTMALAGGSTVSAIDSADNGQVEKMPERPNGRPKLFWVNFVIFVVTMFALIKRMPPYLVFMIATIVVCLINYPNPKDYTRMQGLNGGMFYNMLLVFVAIACYLAAFNIVPADGSMPSMVSALAEAIKNTFPEFLSRYMYLIFAALMVVIIRFVPYKMFNSLYPLFIAVGATFAFDGVEIMAPFVCNLALATGVCPIGTSIYVGSSLCEVDGKDVASIGTGLMSIVNIISLVCAGIFGFLPL